MSHTNSPLKPSPQAVVVLAAARDGYQLPLALREGEMLHTLVTDLYWPKDRTWFSVLSGSFISQKTISARYCSGLASSKVTLSKRALAASAVSYAADNLKLKRYKDRALSKMASRIALREDAALFCCSYYGSEAFKKGVSLKHRFLFQLQADLLTTRRILIEEIERTPAAKKSLSATYELSLATREFEELCNEPCLANGWVTTSTFSARTLSARGIPSDQIHVVPYGVDGTTFAKRAIVSNPARPLKIIFIGSLVQSKGLSYLLEAVRVLKTRNVSLTLCTQGVVDEQLLAEYSDLEIDIKIGLSGRELAKEIQINDVLVFPSLAEGFAHVILETMSCGVPIIATANTCAPDVMTDGVHGFIVPIRDPHAIAERLSWGIDHRADLAAMGDAAAEQAKLFTWEKFRHGIREAYRKMIVSTT